MINRETENGLNLIEGHRFRLLLGNMMPQRLIFAHTRNDTDAGYDSFT